MILARQYNLFPGLSDLSGLDLLLTDHTILNRVIVEENKAQEEAIKKRKEKSDHPGMERFETFDDWCDEAARANRGED